MSLCVALQMSAVGITEHIKGDVKKFEIWYSGREEVYVVQVHISISYCVPCCLHPAPNAKFLNML